MRSSRRAARRSAAAPRNSAANGTRNVCPVCLGIAGDACLFSISNLVEFIARMGLASGCSIAPKSVFARKNYFYPDLPKGYQISQYEEPICGPGGVEIDLDEDRRKTIGITRIHMEEDAGKSIHDIDVDTLVGSQPVWRAADRDRQRTGHPLSPRGLPLPVSHQADPDLPRYLRRRQHGGREVSDAMRTSPSGRWGRPRWGRKPK